MRGSSSSDKALAAFRASTAQATQVVSAARAEPVIAVISLLLQLPGAKTREGRQQHRCDHRTDEEDQKHHRPADQGAQQAGRTHECQHRRAKRAAGDAQRMDEAPPAQKTSSRFFHCWLPSLSVEKSGPPGGMGGCGMGAVASQCNAMARREKYRHPSVLTIVTARYTSGTKSQPRVRTCPSAMITSETASTNSSTDPMIA